MAEGRGGEDVRVSRGLRAHGGGKPEGRPAVARHVLATQAADSSRQRRRVRAVCALSPCGVEGGRPRDRPSVAPLHGERLGTAARGSRVVCRSRPARDWRPCPGLVE